MRVLVGPLCGFDSDRYSIQHVRLDGLREQGYDARPFYSTHRRHDPACTVEPEGCVAGASLTEVLGEYARRGWTPDVVVALYPGENPFFGDLLRAPVPIVAVISDWDAQGHILETALPEFDHVLCEPGARVYAEALGIADRTSHTLIWLPSEPHVESVAEAASDERPHDVAFVGAPYARRSGQLHDLAGRLAKRRLYLSLPMAPTEYVKVLGASKIGLNLSRRGELTPRCFETLLCGALLLTERSDTMLSRYFVEDTHYVAFAGLDELVSQAEGLLDEPERLAAIAAQGRERALELLRGDLAGRLRVWLDVLAKQVGLDALRAACARRQERLAAHPRESLEREAFVTGGSEALPGYQAWAQRCYAQLLEDDAAGPAARARWLHNHRVCRWRQDRMLGAASDAAFLSDGLDQAADLDPGVAALARLNAGVMAAHAGDHERADAAFADAVARLEAAPARVNDAVRAGTLLAPLEPHELFFRGGPQLWSHAVEEPLKVAQGPWLLDRFRDYLTAYCLTERGRLALATERPDDAVTHLQAATRILPEEFAARCTGEYRPVHFCRPHRILGDALRAAGRYAEAADAYRDSLRRIPADRQVWAALAATLMRSDQRDALATFLADRIELLAAFPREDALRARFAGLLTKLEG